MADNNASVLNLDEFNIVHNDSIITPPEASIFSRPVEHFDNFAKSIEGKTVSDLVDPEKPTEGTSTEASTKPEIDINKVLDRISDPDAIVEEEKINTRTSKDSLVDFLEEKIKNGEFASFEDYDEQKPLNEYLSSLTKKDLRSLIEENIKMRDNKIREEAPKQFFENLPYELQVAADYWLNKGGRDLKSLFNALGKVEEVRVLNPTEVTDQEKIVSEYLKASHPDWTREEIDNQIEEWKDLEHIGKKAEMFKPKLDKMREQLVENQLREQEYQNNQRVEAANRYINNVYEALKPGELNGLKLDNKTRDLLYDGLTNARFQTSAGNRTTLLGHLLEKFQYQEPNYQKIAKVLYLLADEEGYEKSIRQQGANNQAEETAKKLKTEQGRRSATTLNEREEPTSRITKLKSPDKSIFSR